MVVIGILVNGSCIHQSITMCNVCLGPYTLISSAVAADLGSHESNVLCLLFVSYFLVVRFERQSKSDVNRHWYH